MGKEKIDIIEFKTSGFAKIGFLTLASLKQVSKHFTSKYMALYPF